MAVDVFVASKNKLLFYYGKTLYTIIEKYLVMECFYIFFFYFDKYAFTAPYALG